MCDDNLSSYANSHHHRLSHDLSSRLSHHAHGGPGGPLMSLAAASHGLSNPSASLMSHHLSSMGHHHHHHLHHAAAAAGVHLTPPSTSSSSGSSSGLMSPQGMNGSMGGKSGHGKGGKDSGMGGMGLSPNDDHIKRPVSQHLAFCIP